LGFLDRPVEAIEVYDEIDSRYSTDPEPTLRSIVALARQGRDDEGCGDDAGAPGRAGRSGPSGRP
jgi:hypothetical protein